MSISVETARSDYGAVAGAAPDQAVRHYVVTNVPTAELTQSVAACRAMMSTQSFEDASHVFVLDDRHRVAGIVKIGQVLAAPAEKILSDLIMPSGSQIVGLETDREDAASHAISAGLSTLAVCDAEGRFVGAVPASALMSILRDEHMEDLHHMAGILGNSEAAQAALTAPPHRRARYRLPWLVIGLFGSAVATAMMAQFEAVLKAKIAVAFFIPAVVYIADAIGTQSEAVAVRGISLTKTRLLPLLLGELATGLLIGITLGAIAFPLIFFAFRDLALAATVSIAVVAASSIATTIGFLLPWIFSRLGYDPALGSGPVATVIQDVLSLAIYFLVAALLVS
jgi:magnesium transporter